MSDGRHEHIIIFDSGLQDGPERKRAFYFFFLHANDAIAQPQLAGSRLVVLH